MKNTAPNLKFVISDWKLGFIDDAGTFTYNANETNPYDATTDGAGTLNIGMWSNNTDAAATKGYVNTLASSVDVAANASEALLDGEMIVIPQSVTAASAYATATETALVNGSYVGLKLKILNRENDSVIYSDGNNIAWAIWPANFTFEPGKKYTFTVDLCGGGYYETNTDDGNADLDPILEGAVISFAAVTVDEFSAQSAQELVAPKPVPNLSMNVEYDFEYQVFMVKCYLPTDAVYGEVTFLVDGVEKETIEYDGNQMFVGNMFYDVAAGTHTFTCIYHGNEKYGSTSISQQSSN